jgi:hypothetical protein
MSTKRTKTCCLAIDASIAHAAGTLESSDPIATRCRDFLLAVRGICHRMAWSEAIKTEWDRHQSIFARQWLVSMMNLRKLRSVKDELLEELRAAIEVHSPDKNVIRIMLKDVHLIEAALATDLRIASLDDTVREHFRRLAASHEPLRRVIWANPTIEVEQVIEWLEAGAPAQRSRQLKR